MNTKKGLFRLTLVISIFVGIITAFLNELFLPRHSITIEIPKHWQMELTEERRQELDGIVQRMLRNNESDQNIRAVVDDFKSKYGTLPTKEKGRLKTIDYLVNNSEFKRLSKIEQSNIKRQFMENIPEIESLKEFGKHLLRIEYTFKPGWRELGLLTLVGFASSWVVYLFIRWVIGGFIVSGFKGKSH
jgi:hypothetical protein